MKLRLTKDLYLWCFPDGSAHIGLYNGWSSTLNQQKHEQGWKISLKRGLVYRKGAHHIDNVTPFAAALGNILQ